MPRHSYACCSVSYLANDTRWCSDPYARIALKIRHKGYLDTNYNLVAFFGTLRDISDPVGVAAHVLQTLKPDGTWMMLEYNLNPSGRIYYSASTILCVPESKDQEVGLALDAQAGEARMHEVVTAGGYPTSGELPRHRLTWCSQLGFS